MRKELILPVLAVLGGGAGFALRRWELAAAFEPGTGLPIGGAPATFALAGFSLLTAVVLALLCQHNKGRLTGGYDQAFSARGGTAYLTALTVSAFLMGASGLLGLYTAVAHGGTQTLTALKVAGVIHVGQYLLCLPGAWGILMVGRNNYQGRKNGKYSAYVLLPAYAGCVWLISAYQGHSGDPVVLDYVYELLAIVAILLGMYFMAGFAFERAKTFRTSFFSLMGIYFTGVTLADGHDLTTLLLFGAFALYLLASVGVLLRNAAAVAGGRRAAGRAGAPITDTEGTSHV